MLISIALAVTLGQEIPVRLAPVIKSDPVTYDADDPAIWYNKKDPSRSLVLGTDKFEKSGGLFVFDLTGKIVQRILGLDRPNNVDVEYDFESGSEKIDIAVVTERGGKRLLIYKIDRKSLQLHDISGETSVFSKRSSSDAVPMGIGLFKNKSNEVYAVVSPKGGPRKNYLDQYKLVSHRGKVNTVYVQSFGVFSGKKEIESIVVDDRGEHIFYSDERVGVRTLHANSKSNLSNQLQGFIDCSHYKGDNEGLAVFTHNGKRLLASCDQIKGGSDLYFYDLMNKFKSIGKIETESDETDGIEICEKPLGSQFPKGILVMMNSYEKRFDFYDLSQVFNRLK